MTLTTLCHVSSSSSPCKVLRIVTEHLMSAMIEQRRSAATTTCNTNSASLLLRRYNHFVRCLHMVSSPLRKLCMSSVVDVTWCEAKRRSISGVRAADSSPQQVQAVVRPVCVSIQAPLFLPLYLPSNWSLANTKHMSLADFEVHDLNALASCGSELPASLDCLEMKWQAADVYYDHDNATTATGHHARVEAPCAISQCIAALCFTNVRSTPVLVTHLRVLLIKLRQPCCWQQHTNNDEIDRIRAMKDLLAEVVPREACDSIRVTLRGVYEKDCLAHCLQRVFHSGGERAARVEVDGLEFLPPKLAHGYLVSCSSMCSSLLYGNLMLTTLSLTVEVSSTFDKAMRPLELLGGTLRELKLCALYSSASLIVSAAGGARPQHQQHLLVASAGLHVVTFTSMWNARRLSLPRVTHLTLGSCMSTDNVLANTLMHSVYHLNACLLDGIDVPQLTLFDHERLLTSSARVPMEFILRNNGGRAELVSPASMYDIHLHLGLGGDGSAETFLRCPPLVWEAARTKLSGSALALEEFFWSFARTFSAHEHGLLDWTLEVEVPSDRNNRNGGRGGGSGAKSLHDAVLQALIASGLAARLRKLVCTPMLIPGVGQLDVIDGSLQEMVIRSAPYIISATF